MRLSSSPNDGGFHRLARASNRHGVALVIVLAFIVLLTGLVVAYFARSITGRMLSNSSAGQTKAAMLAQSAADIVVSGLKQEIVGGSAAPSPSPANFYVPLAAANAVPVRYPTPAPGSVPADPIPNLVRRSVAGDQNIPAPAVSSLASAVNSATAPAINGHTITPARWNSHYLIPSYSAVATPTGNASSIPPSTPDASTKFIAPDWVLFTRAGPAVQTGIGTGATAVNNALPTNQNYVIGRYAYAIYDEGGLLDLNAAGHPTPTTPAATTGFTPTQASRKSSLALADLTQLPIVQTPSSPDPAADATEYLSQAMIDQLVGWRNYASGNPSGVYPNFTFNASSAANWYKNFGNYNTTGFLKVYGGSTGSTGPTDQAFLSRQQLLKLRSSIGFNPNVLQYLGTFSRSLEQPSFIPANLRHPGTAPSINQVSTSTPPVADNADLYAGNNDAAGMNGNTAGQDVINPSFLTVRVISAFTRLDGSAAVVGEPLVKKRASLKRLSWLTYKGPSANNMSDPVVQQGITAMGGNATDPSDPVYKLVAQGTATNIKNYFGLTWDSTSYVWTYNHGADMIRTLSDVAADTGNPREPDFIELLKAAINVGSLAKGGPNLNKYSAAVYNYQYTLDTAVDYNVLQIFADLVDQSDADSYPTVINIRVSPSSGASYYRQIRGVEDVPYFYRYQPFVVTTTLPNPVISKDAAVTFPATTPGYTGSDTQFTFYGLQQGTLSDPGKATFLYVPEVWNPHDANNTANSAAYRPTAFRILAKTTDPIGATDPPWLISIRAELRNLHTNWENVVPPNTYPASTPAPLTEAGTAMQFSDNGGQLFREPTLLWHSSYPNGINLTGGTTVTEANTQKQYVGIAAGTTDISKQVSINGESYVAQALGVDPLSSNPVSNLVPQITFQLQYMNPAGQWVVYDEKYPDLHGLNAPTLIVNKADWPNNAWQNPFSGAFGSSATGYDPRAGRFGIGTANNLGTVPANTSAISVSPEVNTTDNTAVGNSNFTLLETQRKDANLGDNVNYSNPCMTSDPGKIQQMRWASGVGYSASGGGASSMSPSFYDGLLEQNNPSITLTAKDNSTTAHLYYEDADGVARRAMAAYVPTGAINKPATSLVGLPLVPGEAKFMNGIGTPNVYSQNRPFILNRPFRSVGEMSYTWRGGLWKNIDFFTPESGDTGLLDVFCVDEAPSDGMVAGKVNLNTRQAPVIKAILAGAYQDESINLGQTNVNPALSLTATEADAISKQLVSMTTDTAAWRGPLTNVGDLVGRYIGQNVATGGATDQYTFTEPVTSTSYTYSGFGARLSDPGITWANARTPLIQRLREGAIRPLVSSGQARVWNLMIDVVVQSGRYPINAKDLTQFVPDGEQRVWVHVAIDRYTGEVIDKQTEVVTE